MKPTNETNIIVIQNNLSDHYETVLICTDHLTLLQEVENRRSRGKKVGYRLFAGVIIDPGSIEVEKNPIVGKQEKLL